MRILAFDTCTLVGTAAVLDDGVVLSEVSALVRASHGETVLPHLARVLEAAGLTLKDIDLFAVGIGPGSFTGVRIGVATAKGLALSEQKPLVGVSSLRVMARGLTAGDGLRVPVLDAHKGEVYAAGFVLGEGGALAEVVPPFHAAPEAAATRIDAARGALPVWLAGAGVERYGAQLTGPLGANTKRAPRFCDAPRAACLAYEAEHLFKTEGPSDLTLLEPLYLRESDAKLPARPLVSSESGS